MSDLRVTECGLEVHGFQRGAPVFQQDQISAFVVGMINAEDYFKRRVKKMSGDLKVANEKINGSVINIDKNIDRLMDKEKEFIDLTKKISTGIRKNSQSMVDGIVRIKKAANFDELEQYTSVLERYVDALEKLEVLEKSGHLDKISKAMK